MEEKLRKRLLELKMQAALTRDKEELEVIKEEVKNVRKQLADLYKKQITEKGFIK